MMTNNKKFIRLHNAENNSVVVVNVDCIDIVDTDEKNGRLVSTIYTSSDIKEFSVNESPEKIFTMLEEMNNN